MQKLIEIPKDQSILVSSNILKCDKPDCVYIPILPNSKLAVKKNTTVSIGSILYKISDEAITSPISGTVKEIKKINTINGTRDTLVIANDFKEKNITKPTPKSATKKVQPETINQTLSHFNLDLTSKKELVLSCLDDEPYVVTESFYLFLCLDGYLDLLDKLSQIYNLNITICVKSSNSENINKLLECLGMYPNIKLRIIPNLYLLGKDEFMIKYLNLAKEETTILKSSVFYNIYNLIERNRPKSDKLVTITGNGLHNPKVVKVKIGTKVEDIISSVINLKEESLIYILNGLMTGVKKDIENLIITEDLNSILIMKEKKECQEAKCINCGACLDICPVNINPLLLKNPKYYEKVKDKCLKCGLCSYICPSHINFNKYLFGGENE